MVIDSMKLQQRCSPPPPPPRSDSLPMLRSPPCTADACPLEGAKRSHWLPMNPAPAITDVGLALLQKCAGEFCCLNFGGFFPGIFLDFFSHKDEDDKSGDTSREKIRWPQKNPRKNCQSPTQTDELCIVYASPASHILGDSLGTRTTKAPGSQPTIAQLKDACKGKGWPPSGNGEPRQGNGRPF